MSNWWDEVNSFQFFRLNFISYQRLSLLGIPRYGEGHWDMDETAQYDETDEGFPLEQNVSNDNSSDEILFPTAEDQTLLTTPESSLLAGQGES